ncbi:hypothetical protein DLAC_07331 [Tieghemostelium lacteum]|uniref:Uncharacterized protein n=1 Tax=Tieghemostelium lacteum TaxID=361077 RepID=A0A151ZCF9_TIELA|nr:hypothetical protein DLAC_07331 [Tieghemostelium lacteum]|eukprot:KYQ91564.1 hypothetical protein DLAC_07331 [Tieghemostelium lacteum]
MTSVPKANYYTSDGLLALETPYKGPLTSIELSQYRIFYRDVLDANLTQSIELNDLKAFFTKKGCTKTDQQIQDFINQVDTAKKTSICYTHFLQAVVDFKNNLSTQPLTWKYILNGVYIDRVSAINQLAVTIRQQYDLLATQCSTSTAANQNQIQLDAANFASQYEQLTGIKLPAIQC